MTSRIPRQCRDGERTHRGRDAECNGRIERQVPECLAAVSMSERKPAEEGTRETGYCSIRSLRRAM